MAIEIVPKPKKKTKSRIALFSIFYFFVIFVLLTVIVSYFAFYFFEIRLQTRLEELESLIVEARTKETRELEEKVLALGQKINAFGSLLESRQRTTNFFSFLSGVCHQKVFFQQMELDVENSKAEFLGQTQDFTTLKEQISILKNEELIEKTALSRVFIAEQGGVGFELTLFLSNQAFK